MYDFVDDDLSIESYRSIPWLIWIQLLILVLLFFLLYFFTLFVPADHSDQTTSTTASSTSTTSQLVSNETQRHRSMIPKRNTTTNVTNSCLLETITQVGGGIIKREIGITSPSRRSRRLVREAEDQVTDQRESSSGLTPKYHHPCDYFRQATIAFLKCLGFDSTHDQNSFRRETSMYEKL